MQALRVFHRARCTRESHFPIQLSALATWRVREPLVESQFHDMWHSHMQNVSFAFAIPIDTFCIRFFFNSTFVRFSNRPTDTNVLTGYVKTPSEWPMSALNAARSPVWVWSTRGIELLFYFSFFFPHIFILCKFEIALIARDMYSTPNNFRYSFFSTFQFVTIDMTASMSFSSRPYIEEKYREN